jgi:beta-glucanase (GH16 family)
MSTRVRAFPLVSTAVAAVLVAAVSISTHAGAGAAVAPRLTVVFSDTFDGPANSPVDRSKWLYDLGHGYPGGAPNWGTGEVESMTDSTANVFQDGDGHLAIKPLRDATGAFTSGRIETQRTDFAAPPGGRLRIEASIQQPDVSGAAAAGYWPAFWALGQDARAQSARNWPGVGEWDVMEDINGRESVFGTLHCGVAPGGPCNEFVGVGSGERACAGCAKGFHTFAIEYDRSVSPETLRFFRDDDNYFTITENQVDAATWANANHHGFYPILNVAIGGAFPAAFGGGPTSDTRPGVPMLVDSVTVSVSDGK